MRLKAMISGRVHDIGYRVFLTNIALEFGTDRFNVFNTFMEGKESVVCLIDAEEEILNALKERINTQIPDGVIIEEIKYADYKNTVPPIERCMQVLKNRRFLACENVPQQNVSFCVHQIRDLIAFSRHEIKDFVAYANL
ncbi:MAG: hypothetical protein MOIL_01444 [Candidatus Methanolliviera sp. GoM_oil]|nr:MAG: hypothetical protein MOIL_01444 [Candidatus Methanolliviera sp. GoM_oil]